MTEGKATLTGRCKAILFDAGNTLIYAPLEETFVTICRTHGVAVDLEKVIQAYRIFVDESGSFFKKNRELYGANPIEYWRRCNERILEFVGAKADIPPLADRITSDFPSPREIQWKCFPEVPETLGRLRNMGFILGVISNFDASLREELDELGLTQYFQVILTSDEARCAKPDPRIFYLALDAAGVTPEEAIYVGDSYDSDVGGSRRAGLTPVLLDRRQVGARLDCHRIASLDELPNLLQ